MNARRITLGVKLMLGMVSFYQKYISKMIHIFPGTGCRYYPTCSNYMATALQRHGFLKGGWMGVRRICRCHPWGESGIDEVSECD